MEDYAVILANDLVVKASNFGGINNLGFNKQGKVILFTYEGQKNIALFDFKSNMFLDFVEEEYFNKLKAKEVHKEGDKYDGVKKALWAGYVFKKYEKLIRAQFNDKIFGILRDESGLCYNNFTWTYTNPYMGPVNPEKASNASPAGRLCETLANGTPEKAFFDSYKGVKFFDNNESDIRLIGEIALLLKSTGEKTAEAFLNFNLTGVNTTAFTFRTAENGFVREDFERYKKGLELWLKMLKKYQTEIGKLGHEEQLFIAIDVMYRHNMLTLLTVDQRISILKILVEKSLLMNWYWANFSIGFVHKEDLAIKILESFKNSADADSFLKKLVSTNVIESQSKHKKVVYETKYVTLYKMLFYRMDDYGGKDNFTAFAKELGRIVRLKHNIAESNTPINYSIDELKSITKAQFIWIEKQPEKGPKIERVKYEILSNTDKKIEFKETIWLKTRLDPFYTTNSQGIDVIIGYNEVPIEEEKRTFPLNHFDLVSIHFYDNPSFVDLTNETTYVGQNFFTFAGFVDYVLEKERTKVAEEIFNTTLYAISLALGFGELVAAIRSINAARAILGLGMIVSDTAVYLVGETDFHNYLVATYGEAKAIEILGNMAILSTIASLGTNGIAGSGILKTYSRENALKLVGTGEAILKDSVALEKLSSTEIAALKEAITKIKKELYAIRNVPDAVETIVNTKATVFFNKFADLETGINTLSQANKLLFYNKFVSLSEKELDILRSWWLGSNDIAQLEIIQNSNLWLKYIKVRDYLKNLEFKKVAQVFSKNIRNPYTSNGLNFIFPVESDIALKISLISQDTTDFVIIANKLGVDVDVIQAVKKHYFIDEHFVRSELTNEFIIGRFGKDDFDILEWENFRDNLITSIGQSEQDSFRKLIVHEYIESKLMEKGMNFRAFDIPNNYKVYDFGAHDLAPLLSNGNYLDLGRLSNMNPPIIDFNNIVKQDLDNVVNWYINFYKL